MVFIGDTMEPFLCRMKTQNFLEWFYYYNNDLQ